MFAVAVVVVVVVEYLFKAREFFFSLRFFTCFSEKPLLGLLLSSQIGKTLQKTEEAKLLLQKLVLTVISINLKRTIVTLEQAMG